MVLFNNAIDIASYDDAYMALTRINNFETYPHPLEILIFSQRSALEILIVAMVEHGQSSRLCSFPFADLQDLVDDILVHKAEEVVDVRPSPSYHKILFSWRIKHGDFQGGKILLRCILQ